jgi:hypothetical protein
MTKHIDQNLSIIGQNGLPVKGITMNSVPKYLYSKEILSYIDYLIDTQEIKDFNSLDQIDKDKLVALGIHALGCDVEIILSETANKSLINYLFLPDKDNQIELINEVRNSSYEKFSDYFDQIIDERKDDCFISQLRSNNFAPYTDQITGETLWRKIG